MAAGQLVVERAQRPVRQIVDVLETSEAGMAGRPGHGGTRLPERTQEGRGEDREADAMEPAGKITPQTEEADDQKQAEHGERRPECRPDPLERVGETGSAEAPAKTPLTSWILARSKIAFAHGLLPSA